MGILNFSVVDHERLIFRGGQPVTPQDYDSLRNMGVTQIIKLNPHNVSIEVESKEKGFEWFYAPISTVEQILTEPDFDYVRGAVNMIRPRTYIHCEHGQDRTGLVVALYRISRGWNKELARTEMLALGFHKILLGLDKAFHDLTKE